MPESQEEEADLENIDEENITEEADLENIDEENITEEAAPQSEGETEKE